MAFFCDCKSKCEDKRLFELSYQIRDLTRKVLLLEGYDTGIFKCTGGVNGKLPTELSRSDIDRVIAYMLQVTPFDNSCVFKMKIPLNLVSRIENVYGFIKVKDYPIAVPIRDEIGAIGNCLVYIDQNQERNMIELCLLHRDNGEHEKKFYIEYSNC